MKIGESEIDEIKEFWGKNGLYLWQSESLTNLELSERTKIFLSNIGIPKVKPFEETIWFFEEFINLIPLKTYFGNLETKYSIPSNIENCYVFANECDGICCFYICAESEDIFYFNPEVKESTRYCNSSMEIFCYFLTEFYKTGLYIKENKLSEDNELKIIQTMTKNLSLLNPKAFEIEDSFWNSVILDFQ